MVGGFIMFDEVFTEIVSRLVKSGLTEKQAFILLAIFLKNKEKRTQYLMMM